MSILAWDITKLNTKQNTRLDTFNARKFKMGIDILSDNELRKPEHISLLMYPIINKTFQI